MAQSTSGHDSVFVSKEVLEYLYVSNVNVANFVSVKLSGQSNYHIWMGQMLSLMDKLGIRDIVENPDNWLKAKGEDMARKYDILLKGWILGSLNEEVLRHHEFFHLKQEHGKFIYLDYYSDEVAVQENNRNATNHWYSTEVECIWAKLADEYCFRWYPTATKTAGELLSEDQKSFEEFIIRLIYRKEYNLALKLYKLHLKSQERPTDKVLLAITRNFPSDIGIGEALIYPSWENAYQNIVKRSSFLFHSFENMYARAKHTLWRFKNNYYSWWLPEIVMLLLVPIALLYPLYQLILLFILVLLLPFHMMYSLLWKVLATVVAPIKDIEKRKKDYKQANIFLHNTVRLIDSFNLNNSHFYKVIAYAAVCLDVYEVLRLIISNFKQTIQYTNERHNIIQLAIMHRSEKVYNHILYPLIKQNKYRRELKDYSFNNLLHLVGRLAPSNVLSCTTGAALQLQRELQWYEEVEKFMEPMQLSEVNIDNETPDVKFTREHENLVKDGEKWMKATAESSSITAVLIVTIVFAAAVTVPGGSNHETGIPLFKKQIAFNVFAISDAISLFSASTSLLVFLSILTTRFAEKDFLHSLPRRLLIALFLLFLSTSSMMLAFSAILFLVFCDQRPWMLAPIGVFKCMPIAAIVSLQLPLVVELYRSTYSSRFGKQKLHYSQL